MAAPFPSLTKTWHTTPYPAISPTLPSLSASKKTILITGGGSGIGAATAISFAAAGAPRIALVGRTPATLSQTKTTINSLYPSAEVLLATGDIADKASITSAFEKVHATFGKIDVFVSNAGFLSSPAPIAELDAEDWWTGLKINTLGGLYALQAFQPRAAADAVIINISSGIAHFPAIPGFSGYAASKLAGAKLFEYFQAENQGFRVVNVQPGVVVTTLNQKSGMAGLDSVELPGQFAVWLASPEAKFLKGKFVYANWDVDELKAKAGEIESGSDITLGLYGLPAADLSVLAG